MNNIPKTYLISLAVSDYTYWDKLPNAIKDSNDLVAALVETYKVELHERLHDKEAVSNNMSSCFKRLGEKINPEDSLMFFFNGHGDVYNNSTYLLLRDAKKDKDQNWYSWHDLITDLRGLDLKHIALFINCCYSGNIFLENHKVLKESENEKSRILFTSGRPYQAVADSSNLNSKNSPFIDCIVDTLRSNNTKLYLPLRDIIGYTIGKFGENNFGSKPRTGTFDGDEGGEFYLSLKKDEDFIWNDAQQNDNIEKYEAYLQQFANGKYRENAEKRKDELITEQDEWLLCNQKISTLIKDFISKENTTQPKFKTKAVKLLEQFEKTTIDLTSEQVAEKVWREILPHKRIHEFMEFIKNYEGSIYVSEAERIIKHQQEQDEDQKLWDSIPKNKQKKPETRRGEFANYLIKHRFGKYSSIAYDKIRELDLWIDAKNEQDVNLKREKLRRFQSEITEGDYRRDVEREFEQVSIEVSAKKLSEELYIAIELNDYKPIYDIIAHIDGCTNPEEIAAYKETLKLAKGVIEKYESQIREEFDNAIKNDKAYLLYDFIKKYEDNELSERAKEKLNSKDHDLFDRAEMTKETEDYKLYIDEFENCKGIYITDANARIKELSYFRGLHTKEDFDVYLSTYPKGVMRKEAQEEINNIKRKEEKERRFNEAINGQSIELCTRYLLDYEEEDSKKQEMVVKLEELEVVDRDEKAFNQILELEGREKLKYCNSYLLQFENGIHIIAIREMISDLEKELKDNDDFINAEKLNTLRGFEEYRSLHPKGLNLKKSDDYITFLKARETGEIYPLQEYKKQFPDGLNIPEANDCIAFLEAKQQNRIFNLEKYIQDYSPNGLYHAEAKEIIKQLRLEEEEDKVFQSAKESNDINLYMRYLNGTYPKKPENEDFAKQKIKEIKLNQEDNNDYEEANKYDNEQALVEYISKYGINGIHYKAATKKLREIHTGLTEKDKNLVDKIEGNTAIVSDLSTNIQKGIKVITWLLGFVLVAFLIFISIFILKK